MLPPSLTLDRDLIFFDLETTGLDLLNDRIVQLAFVRYPADGGKAEEHDVLINPGRPIPKIVTDIHGVTDEMVKDAKTFEQLAAWLYLLFKDADLAGFNSNRFDIPLLIEEFGRVGLTLDMKNRRLVDVQSIFHRMEPRNLKAAYKFYCGKPLENAHNALFDVRATADVFFGQLERYVDKTFEDENGNPKLSPVKPDIAALHKEFTDHSKLDSSGKFRRQPNGVVTFGFGKHNGQPVGNQVDYMKWMLMADFSAEVKTVIRGLLKEMGI